MANKKLNLVISLFIGLILFAFFIWWLGPEAIILIFNNFNPYYLGLYLIFAFFPFVFIAWRWKVILKTYRKKVPFFDLVRNVVAGYTVSYVTPSARIGGEPLRAYMLKKENNIDLETGSASIIMEKFVDVSGSFIFGLIGISLFLYYINVPFYLAMSLVAIISILFLILAIFYYRTVRGKGFFSSIYLLFRLNKISKLKGLGKSLIEIEKKMKKFFTNHKKEFFMTFLIYFLQMLFMIFEMKFLLLSFGVNESLMISIFIINVMGIANLVPVPASLGFLEAGESGLLHLVLGNGIFGVALSLIMRVKYLIFITFGFSIISHFSGKQIEGYYSGKRELEERLKRPI